MLVKIIPQPEWKYWFTCKFANCKGHNINMCIGKKKGDLVLCGDCLKSQILL